MTEAERMFRDMLVAMLRAGLSHLPPDSELARPLREAAARLEAAK